MSDQPTLATPPLITDEQAEIINGITVNFLTMRKAHILTNVFLGVLTAIAFSILILGEGQEGVFYTYCGLFAVCFVLGLRQVVRYNLASIRAVELDQKLSKTDPPFRFISINSNTDSKEPK